MGEVVNYNRENEIAYISVNSPPVNALSVFNTVSCCRAFQYWTLKGFRNTQRLLRGERQSGGEAGHLCARRAGRGHERQVPPVLRPGKVPHHHL